MKAGVIDLIALVWWAFENVENQAADGFDLAMLEIALQMLAEFIEPQRAFDQ
jgi:hypothetical protein